MKQQAHAPFAPSSADRWMACTASFGKSLQLPESPSSAYSAEGTRLHEVAAVLLDNDRMDADAQDEVFLQPYLKLCRQLTKLADWVAVEERLQHSALLFGTADFVARIGSVLHVVDLKTGSGVMVEPLQNSQLMLYAYMALTGLRLSDIDEVVLTIVQPPDTNNPVKSWTTTPDDVYALGEKAEEAIQMALQGSVEFVMGDHCRWCRAKPVCPRLRGMVDVTPTDILAADLGALATAEVLDRADLVLQFIDAVREHGHDLIKRGIAVPGWTLKPKRATRQWADEDKVLEIARRRRIKIWQDKLMSPAMAEKAHPNLPAELADLIVAISSGTNLVRGNPAPVLAPSPDAAPMERLMANIETLKYRK